ncbi:hypothetical protein LP420_14010 [Massilia sp. B-10]|nr:hypothetical protein LP420_14010 [Massilia sp. B-10]
MLKFFFWALLAINAVLFAYGQGYLGTYKPTEHEPERIRSQLATDKLQLLSAAAAAQGHAWPSRKRLSSRRRGSRRGPQKRTAGLRVRQFRRRRRAPFRQSDRAAQAGRAPVAGQCDGAGSEQAHGHDSAAGQQGCGR